MIAFQTFVRADHAAVCELRVRDMFGMWRISIKQLVEYGVNAKSFPQLRLCHAYLFRRSAVNHAVSVLIFPPHPIWQ